MFRSLRAHAGMLVVGALLVGLPVVGLASPAGALSSGCTAFNGSALEHSAAAFGFSFDAGDVVTVTAASPTVLGPPTEVVITEGGVTVASTPFPGTVSYTFPAATSSEVAVSVDAGDAILTFSCSHPSVPGAPTITSVFAGPSPDPAPVTVGIAFTPPSSEGGSPITGYTATCVSTDGYPTESASGPASPIYVSELAYNGAYQCSVAATNASGTGPASAPFSVGLGGQGLCTGATLTAPTMLSSAPGDGSAVVSWAPSQSTPPGCVSGYEVTPSVGGVAQPSVLIDGPGTTTVISGLTNGQAYTFTVAAENGATVGPQSVKTGPITIGTPAAATSVQVSHVVKNAVKVAFTAPHDNGAPITKYTAKCQSYNGATKSTSSKSGPLTVAGLTPDKTYACTVTATNSRGSGARSAWSAAIKA